MHGVAGCLELVDDMFYVLCVILVGNHHRVRCIDHQQVLHANQCSQAPLTVHVVVTRAVRQHFTFKSVAVLVSLGQFTDRVPGADIAPADIARHGSHFGRTLHQCIINGNIRHFRECIRIKRQATVLVG
ncbi:hypothetical protein D3C76_1208410 [compost metagenome]